MTMRPKLLLLVLSITANGLVFGETEESSAGRDVSVIMKGFDGEWSGVVLVHGYPDNLTPARSLVKWIEEAAERPPGSFDVKILSEGDHNKPRKGKDVSVIMKGFDGEWSEVVLVHGYPDNLTPARTLVEWIEKAAERPPGSFDVREH